MTAEAALSRLRRYQHKAVITGGDRTDIQLTALETSTVCLILTGNLHPSPTVLERADEAGVAVLLVPDNTLETVEAIERVFGKTRLGHPEKLARFEAVMADHMDFETLFSLLGI
jgi:BioD-like phosphotransacetylase family protein